VTTRQSAPARHTVPDKQGVIDEIIQAQHDLQRGFADDRANPLFHSQLTMSQLKLLLMLRHSGGSGGQELARGMGVGLATLTGIIDRMVSQGLVTRREDPTDRRVRIIELTAHGRRMVDEIVTTGTQRLRDLLDRVEPDGLDVILRALRLLCGAMRGEKGGPCAPGAAEPARAGRLPSGGDPAPAGRRPT